MNAVILTQQPGGTENLVFIIILTKKQLYLESIRSPPLFDSELFPEHLVPFLFKIRCQHL